MEIPRESITRQDGFSAVSERQQTDERSKMIFAFAAVMGAGGIAATLIFALLGHGGLQTLALG